MNDAPDGLDARLHAYADGQMPEAERVAFEAHLAAHPDDARRVREITALDARLRRAFDPVLDEPHAFDVRALEPRAANAVRRWPLWAGAAATLLLGVAIGFALREALPRDAAPAGVSIARHAALAHAAYRPEVRHPVEVAAAEEAHLVAWLSKRLAAPIRAPQLGSAGFQLLGGRLLPAAGDAAAPVAGDPSPVALLVYENARGARLSLLVRREAPGESTAFRFAQQGGTSVFYWIDGSFGYALAGELPRGELAPIAQLVYRQLNP